MRYSSVIGALVAEREKQGLTQAALAQALGISNVKLHRWETERNRATQEDLERWAEALGLQYAVSVQAPTPERLPALRSMISSLPEARQQAVLEFAHLMRDADERDYRLLVGMIRQMRLELESAPRKSGTA